MSTSRVSRGFHRLAVFVAAIPLLIGVTISLSWAGKSTYQDLQRHQLQVCAHEHIERVTTPKGEAAALPSIGQEPNSAGTNLGTLSLPSIGEETKPNSWPENNPFHLMFAPDETPLNLKRMGCSDSDYETVSLGEASTVPEFYWYPRLGYYLSIGVGLSLLLSFAVYGLVRAIGWVIGGFAAS